MHSQEHILNTIKENLFYFEARTEPDDEWGERDIMKLSIGCTLYFYNGHKSEIRALMPKLVKEFYEQFGTHFTGGCMHNKENQTSYGKLTQKLLEKCFNPDTWRDVDEAMEFVWDNPDAETTTGYRFSMLLQDEYTSWDCLSNIRLSIPYDSNELETWLTFIKKICRHIPMHCGNVGYYSLLPDQYYAYEEHQTPIAYRFYGCDIDSGLAVELNRPPLGIKSINWLTILGKDFVEQMYGETSLRIRAEQLGSGVEKVGDNLIIQAGPYPDICDNKDLPMNPYYVAVNHLLKPIRKETIGSLHMDSMTGKAVLNTAASDEWLRRFDQYPMPEIKVSTTQPSAPEQPAQPNPTPSFTGKQMKAGDTCTSTGWYFANHYAQSIQHFKAGEVVNSPKYHNGNAVIWLELTPEAVQALRADGKIP